MGQTTGHLLLGATIKPEHFAEFIKAYQLPPSAEDKTLMLLEIEPRDVVTSVPSQDLLIFQRFNPTFDFAPYTSGRIFHTEGELHWERQENGNVQIVYTGNGEYKPTLDDSKTEMLDSYDSEPRSYFLFGTRLSDERIQEIGSPAQAGDFAEVRIPRLLRYPPLDSLKGAERIMLEVCEYMDRETGVNVAYRFTQLKPFNKPKKEENG